MSQTFDNVGHNYTFNICGTSSKRCLPTWKDVYQFGVAVQVTAVPTPSLSRCPCLCVRPRRRVGITVLPRTCIVPSVPQSQEWSAETGRFSLEPLFVLIICLHGVVVCSQTFGPVPPCNTSNPTCTDPQTNQKM